MLNILLVQPYQPGYYTSCQPPTGLLYLASALRMQFTGEINVRVVDLRLTKTNPHDFLRQINIRQYHAAGISAMNIEATVARELAKGIKQVSPETLTALGGAYAHSGIHSSSETTHFDFIFRGEAEFTFPLAISAFFFHDGELSMIPGLTWRTSSDEPHIPNPGVDVINDLGTISLPAWDLVPFDLYARRHCQNGWLKGKRYAPIFTSRGCPYQCVYCHNIFGKKFRWRSTSSCMDEISFLVEQFGVDEFQFNDDIFNLNKSRIHELSDAVIQRFGERKLKFCFPNGLRADILEESEILTLYRMGTYQVNLAVESASPRLQHLIKKRLDLTRTREIIHLCEKIGIVTGGFFMLGFPTEQISEMKQTIHFAKTSDLTFVNYNLVVPQSKTSLHEIAVAEEKRCGMNALNRNNYFYFDHTSWYQHCYGIDLRNIQRHAYLQTFFVFRRLWKIWKAMPIRWLIHGCLIFIVRSSQIDRFESLLNKLKRKMAIF